MKKSIGIIAAIVFSASVFSQSYDPAKPHQSATQSDSASQSFSSRSEESSPGSAEYDAQSSLRAQGDSNQGAAKQGLTLTDEEAAQVLRNTDDTDLANRNQEQGLTDPDRVANENQNNDSEPDMIYEEWILITPEDVGGPPQSESESSSSRETTDIPANPKPEWGPEEEYFSQFDRETGQLNDERIYNGGDYSQDYVGGPAQSESGAVRSRGHKDDDDCEVVYDKNNNLGSVRSSDSDNYRGTAAQYESDSETISEPADTDTNRSSDLNEQESNSDSNTIPPDL